METKTATRAFLTTLMMTLVFCSSCSNDDSNKPDPAKRDTDIEAEGNVVQAIEDALVPICDENGASKSSGIWVSEWVNPWFQVNENRKKYLGTHLVLEYYDSAVKVLGLSTITPSDGTGQNDAALVWKIS